MYDRDKPPRPFVLAVESALNTLRLEIHEENETRALVVAVKKALLLRKYANGRWKRFTLHHPEGRVVTKLDRMIKEATDHDSS